MEKPDDDEDTIACLARTQIFKELSAESLRRLAAVCSKKRIPKGFVLFVEGERAEQLYIIMRGAIAEYATGPNEIEVIIKELKRGDYLGDIGILVDEPHYITAIASQPTTVLVLSRNEFLYRVRTEPSVSQTLVKTLAHRLLLAARHSIAYSNLDSTTRLAYLVLTLERQEGGKGFVSCCQDDLARRCGLARQTVARVLGAWRDAGWVRTNRGRLEDIDTAALNRILPMSCYDKDTDVI
ncbi:MAG: Crp/Fnr family transcriptional regulator [Spirochaetes bacterium]|nr:Crp/Fnr family transcriptional regulator [Spirochaetota bacterium]MBU1081441.1 Crp/Fnr family transcriptional regulator [Spirochaetota bacterium]